MPEMTSAEAIMHAKQEAEKAIAILDQILGETRIHQRMLMLVQAFTTLNASEDLVIKAHAVLTAEAR